MTYKVAVDFNAEEVSDEFLEQVFITKENENQEWRKSVLSGKIQAKEDENLNYLRYFIDEFLANYTVFPQDRKEIIEEANLIISASRGKIKSFVLGVDNITFETEKGNMTAEILSRKIPGIVKILPNIESEERYGNCHYDAIVTSLETENKHCVATGYVEPLSKRDGYLHSWIETVEGGVEYVFDPSRNLIMKKEDYYSIRGIDSPVHKIDGETIDKETPVLNYLKEKNWLYVKLYLANRPLALDICKKLLAEDKSKNEREEG